MADFSQRAIKVVFQLGTGALGETPGAEISVSNLRVKATIISYTGAMQAQAQFVVYGMPLELINQLTVIGSIQSEVRRNVVKLYAGEKGGAMELVYTGSIMTAYGDLSSAPDVGYVCTSLCMGWESINQAPPSTYNGEVAIVDMAQTLADALGLELENNNVSGTLHNRSYNGSAIDQLKELSRDAHFSYAIQGKKLAIWPTIDGARTVPPVYNISPDAGLIGYPMFNSYGVVLNVTHTPQIELGAKINLKSSITPACGEWVVYKIAHEIESETPNGVWMTRINATKLGL